MAHSTHHADYQLLLALLRTSRESAPITQTALADRLGATQTFVSKYERGERRLDVVEVVEICEALNLNPTNLFADYLEQRRSARRAMRPAPKVGKRNKHRSS